MWNHVVSSPGNDILLGSPEGGRLILGPPGQPPAGMNLTMLQNRTWFLLREPGPDNGYAAGASADFPIATVTQDLNIAFGEFLSQTGIAPGLVERQDVLPVFPVLDYPVPPGLQTIIRIEYTPYGMPTYVLDGKSFNEFDSYTGGWISKTTGGNPYIYREPFAGYVRLQPQPGPGNAVGPGVGVMTLTGVPAAGQHVTVTLDNPPGTPVVVPAYTVKATDDLDSIMSAVATLINNSNAVVGPTPFLAACSASQNQITLNALLSPGTQITFAVAVSGTLVIDPVGVTNLSPTGDSMTWYYLAAGNVLALGGDTPQMPSQFHMALVYRVLADYWEVKQDSAQADRYMKKFEMMVVRGKAFQYDTNRATQPTMAGEDIENYFWATGEFF